MELDLRYKQYELAVNDTDKKMKKTTQNRKSIDRFKR